MKIEKRLQEIKDEKKEITSNGTLFCSGMIAGEGLVGILLALLAVFGVDKVLDLSGFINLPEWAMSILGLAVFALIILSVLKFSVWKKRAKKNEK